MKPIRLSLLHLSRSFNWAMLKFFLAIVYCFFVASLIILILRNVAHKSSNVEKPDIKSINQSQNDEIEVEKDVGHEDVADVEKKESHLEKRNVDDDNDEEDEEDFKINVMASDRMMLRRVLDDVRALKCTELVHDSNDDISVSVIMMVTNTASSVILRSIWSVIDRSPVELLKEILVIDVGQADRNTMIQIEVYSNITFPSYVRIIKDSKGRNGYNLGAERAIGNVLIFLDTFTEVTNGWMQPLVQSILDQKDAVMLPVIDRISPNDFSYTTDQSLYTGGFTWSGHFAWELSGIPLKNLTSPAKSATIPGGIMALKKDLFLQIGGFQSLITGTSAQILEFSFRIWMCDKNIFVHPCSRVGHLLLKVPGYESREDVGTEMAVIAETWWDDYKKFLYLYRPDLKIAVELYDVQDRLNSLKTLKRELKCLNVFEWYFDEVYPAKFEMAKDSERCGRVRNQNNPLMCLETRNTTGLESSSHALQQEYCSEGLVDSKQYFCLSFLHEVRTEFACAQVIEESSSSSKGVIMAPCHSQIRGETNMDFYWTFKGGKLRNHNTGLCLTGSKDEFSKSDVIATECEDGHYDQIWDFEPMAI